MKKIIYGESNFRKIKINNDYLYIDKTKYIKNLESLNEDFVIFLRPRRFGKSLFLSTLQYYYDENSRDEFEVMFHDTYIGKKPTPLKNSYRILFFEFSGINTDSGMEIIYEGFKDSIKSAIYRYFYSYGYDISRESFARSHPSSVGYAYESHKLFKNSLMLIYTPTQERWERVLVSKGGFVRSFYEAIKGATQTGTVQKMFITGVTPITLDSLSSGFNIVKHITYRKEFNDLAGFTQKEVEYSLEESIFRRCKDIDRDELLEKIKTWYNGYLFNAEAEDRIYNSTLLNYFITEYNFDKCQMPTKMLDSNVASDYRAIMKLFNIGDSERNYKILQELIETGEVTGVIKDRYDLGREFSTDDFITLIYSMGFITIKDEIFGGMHKFEIPNYVIKVLYFNYFTIELERRNSLKISDDMGRLLLDLALGDIEPFKNRLSMVIKTLSNRDHQGFNEKHFQVIALSLLSFAEFYFTESQPEKDRKIPDIILSARDERVPNNYLFELKWKKDKDSYNSIKEKGIEQVKGYLELDKVKAIPKLRSYLLIGSKDGVEFLEVG
ncbi:AAA family ATPase [Sulfurovum sp. bin170]|uniref:AAA family ATPase n=1 Tax=Sulfurovum sp. bin170 TaxID=2695268 RepID=UPI0013DE7C74|nr:AAA family ATPase [Sulfurovum sp. bin170]NEW59924.1 AAA family ATPase [Sulfurovum sp. bin170]